MSLHQLPLLTNIKVCWTCNEKPHEEHLPKEAPNVSTYIDYRMSQQFSNDYQLICVIFYRDVSSRYISGTSIIDIKQHRIIGTDSSKY
jgi:hypothetical protein